MQLHFSFLLLASSISATIGAPHEPKDGIKQKAPDKFKVVVKHDAASVGTNHGIKRDAMAHPYTLAQLEQMQVQDWTHLNHENHLKDLTHDELARFSKPLFGYTKSLLNTRNKAEAEIHRHGGTPGNILSGEAESHPHHVMHAGAQNGLHQLIAPLKAVYHATQKGGDQTKTLIASNYVRNAQLDPHVLNKDNHPGREIFRQMVGKETKYHRKQGGQRNTGNN